MREEAGAEADDAPADHAPETYGAPDDNPFETAPDSFSTLLYLAASSAQARCTRAPLRWTHVPLRWVALCPLPCPWCFVLCGLSRVVYLVLLLLVLDRVLCLRIDLARRWQNFHPARPRRLAPPNGVFSKLLTRRRGLSPHKAEGV